MYRAKYEYIVDCYYVLQTSADLEYLPEANRASVRMERGVGYHEYILKRITLDAIGIVWDTLGSSRGSHKIWHIYIYYISIKCWNSKVGLGNKTNLSYVFPDIFNTVDVKNSIYVNHSRNKMHIWDPNIKVTVKNPCQLTMCKVMCKELILYSRLYFRKYLFEKTLCFIPIGNVNWTSCFLPMTLVVFRRDTHA